MKRNLAVAPETVRGMMALIAIAEHASFAAAAKDLGLTASAVSKLVSRMEERLKTRLVHRTTRRVQLTEIGLLYCERARPLVEEVGARGREVPVVLAYQRQYPGVRVLFDMTDDVIDLIKQRVDVAVRTAPQPPDAMVA